jgi:hypothetical protein
MYRVCAQGCACNRALAAAASMRALGQRVCRACALRSCSAALICEFRAGFEGRERKARFSLPGPLDVVPEGSNLCGALYISKRRRFYQGAREIAIAKIA